MSATTAAAADCCRRQRPKSRSCLKRLGTTHDATAVRGEGDADVVRELTLAHAKEVGSVAVARRAECFGVPGEGDALEEAVDGIQTSRGGAESPRGAQTPANWGEHKVNRGIIRGDRERRRDAQCGGGRRRPKQRAAPALAQN